MFVYNRPNASLVHSMCVRKKFSFAKTLLPPLFVVVLKQAVVVYPLQYCLTAVILHHPWVLLLLETLLYVEAINTSTPPTKNNNNK